LDVLAHPKVARALEQELVRIMVHCLTDKETEVNEARGLRRPSIMRRSEQTLEMHSGRPLYKGEICSALGVLERTLRYHGMEHLKIHVATCARLPADHIQRQFPRRCRLFVFTGGALVPEGKRQVVRSGSVALTLFEQ